jgi:phage RecT family recombinase
MPSTRNTPPANPNALAPIDMFRRDLVAEENAIALMLGESADVARFRELIIDAVAKDSNLLRCTPVSLMRSVRDMAKLNLEPVLGEAYLVPFWSTSAGSYQATLIIGYEGLKTLAFNSGFVTLIEGDVVREHDEFVYVRGYPESTLRHVRADGDRGGIKGAWAMVWLRDSPRPLMDYLPAERIDQARKVSKSGTADDGSAKGIWRTWEEEMTAKTVLRHALKLAPKSVRARVAAALNLEDAVDSLLSLNAADVRQVGPGTGSPRRRRMVARLAGATEPEGTPEPVVEGQVTEVSGDDALGATESGAEPSVDAQGAQDGSEAGRAVARRAGPISEAPAGVCGNPSTFDDDGFCGLPADHLTANPRSQVHRQLDATGKVVASWPAK